MRIDVKSILPLFAVALILSVFPASLGRYILRQDPQTDPAPAPKAQDPITLLNLTPEQRQKIRIIREQTKNERAAINQQLRQSNLALQQALDADNPDEAVVELRLRDAAAAQAAASRMKVLTELRIRRVLTPEQVNTWRLLLQQAAQARREQRLENQRSNRPETNNAGPTKRSCTAPSTPAQRTTKSSPLGPQSDLREGPVRLDLTGHYSPGPNHTAQTTKRGQYFTLDAPSTICA
jgi:Spy/CpxP family protein refolding chaperone